MENLQVIKYTADKKTDWDTFVKQSKNGTFQFYRDFMEYHQDRFDDFSLMVYDKNKLVALLPANKANDELYSHQGLTYGGLVLSKKVKFENVLIIFRQSLQFLAAEGVQTVHLKLVPKIYHNYPADEMDYLLFLVNAKLIRRDLSSTIDRHDRLKIQSNRMEGVKKAKKQELQIKQNNDFESFWKEILIPNLQRTHAAKPVHSSVEITKLAETFPQHIQQFNVYQENQLVGGATIFETETVAHVQYISANQEKQRLGTLDFLFQYLIEEKYAGKKYFDFGVSNENQGRNLNKGLLYWKECFGARAITHDFYEIKTSNYHKLDKVFI